jgi:translation initiation factor RLI1
LDEERKKEKKKEKKNLFILIISIIFLGINIFLEGMVPTENLRFREESLTFRMVEKADEEITKKNHRYTYPAMNKALGDFSLEIKAGDFTDSEILVMLGQNGTGKTTFIRMLAGLLKADTQDQVPELNVSYKPQKISPKFDVNILPNLPLLLRPIYLFFPFFIIIIVLLGHCQAAFPEQDQGHD